MIAGGSFAFPNISHCRKSHALRCASNRLWSAGSIANSSMAFLMAVSASGASTWHRSEAGVPFRR